MLELYGTGNIRTRKTDLLDAIKLALSKGILVVAVSQCIDSRVDLTAYALGRTLFEMGVVSGVDMTTECVAAKVSYLLGKADLTHDDVKMLIGKRYGPFVVCCAVSRYRAIEGCVCVCVCVCVLLGTSSLRGELTPDEAVTGGEDDRTPLPTTAKLPFYHSGSDSGSGCGGGDAETLQTMAQCVGDLTAYPTSGKSLKPTKIASRL